jgi:hypothetical protein
MEARKLADAVVMAFKSSSSKTSASKFYQDSVESCQTPLAAWWVSSPQKARDNEAKFSSRDRQEVFSHPGKGFKNSGLVCRLNWLLNHPRRTRGTCLAVEFRTALFLNLSLLAMCHSTLGADCLKTCTVHLQAAELGNE